jgi:hypothetical protein
MLCSRACRVLTSLYTGSSTSQIFLNYLCTWYKLGNADAGTGYYLNYNKLFPIAHKEISNAFYGLPKICCNMKQNIFNYCQLFTVQELSSIKNTQSALEPLRMHNAPSANTDSALHILSLRVPGYKHKPYHLLLPLCLDSMPVSDTSSLACVLMMPVFATSPLDCVLMLCLSTFEQTSLHWGCG